MFTSEIKNQIEQTVKRLVTMLAAVRATAVAA